MKQTKKNPKLAKLIKSIKKAVVLRGDGRYRLLVCNDGLMLKDKIQEGALFVFAVYEWAKQERLIVSRVFGPHTILWQDKSGKVMLIENSHHNKFVVELEPVQISITPHEFAFEVFNRAGTPNE